MEDKLQKTPYPLRFPDGMREQIAEAAKANGRSMNAEIIKRLQDSFSQPFDPLAKTDEKETTSSAADLKQLIKDVADIKRQVTTYPLHLSIRKDGSMWMYGEHRWAQIKLLEAGIEAEQKHDHHAVSKQDVAQALEVLKKNSFFSITTSLDQDEAPT